MITPTHAGASLHVAVYSMSNDAVPSRGTRDGDGDVVVEPRRALPLDHRFHDHHVEVGEERDLRSQPERLEEPGLRLVEVREPMGVEHHSLRVDLGVARADVMDEHAYPRSSAPWAATTASIAR